MTLVLSQALYTLLREPDLHFEKVLLEIRRDIGYKNKKLNRGDLLKVFLDRPGIDTLIVAEEQKGSSKESQ